MAEHRLDAIVIESGATFEYFTGVRWGVSDRLAALAIPAKGEPAIVCPAFEEGTMRERLVIELELRFWHEHVDPCAVVAGFLSDRGAAAGRIGLESQIRYYAVESLRRELAGAELTAAEPVIRPLRARKTETEIALLQQANDITVDVFKEMIAAIDEGITAGELNKLSSKGFRARGVSGGIGIQLGLASAYPHGLREQQPLREGDIVLMDGGCKVGGYQSDITRTLVFGTPTDEQRSVWDLERAAQVAAFEAARPGTPCEDVDAAARQVIVDAGYGPDYELPVLPHRTGHGIGTRYHEHEYIVRGNKTPHASGMCFTDEPMIVIPGKFGVRLEDDIYMTEDGPRWFTQPAPSIDVPFVE
jgi:Xaa-Pro dipeptidase